MISTKQQNQKLLSDFIRKNDNLLHQEIFGYLKKRLGNYHDAEDVMAETQLKAHLNEGTYNPSLPLRSWLYTMTNNLVIDYKRKNRKRKFYSFSERINSYDENKLTYDPKDPHKGPEQIATQKEEAKSVRAKITQLTPIQRDAIISFYFHGKPYSQIAEENNIPRSTIKMRLSHARKKLKEKLKVA